MKREVSSERKTEKKEGETVEKLKEQKNRRKEKNRNKGKNKLKGSNILEKEENREKVIIL